MWPGRSFSSSVPFQDGKRSRGSRHRTRGQGSPETVTSSGSTRTAAAAGAEVAPDAEVPRLRLMPPGCEMIVQGFVHNCDFD